MMKRESDVWEEPRDEAVTQPHITKPTDTWMKKKIKKASWYKSHSDSSAQKNIAYVELHLFTTAS